MGISQTRLMPSRIRSSHSGSKWIKFSASFSMIPRYFKTIFLFNTTQMKIDSIYRMEIKCLLEQLGHGIGKVRKELNILEPYSYLLYASSFHYTNEHTWIDKIFFLGQVFSQNLLPRLRNVQHKTAEGSPSDDDSYLGYSVTTGEFDGNPSSADAAVGMPRGSGLNGKVRMFLFRWLEMIV